MDLLGITYFDIVDLIVIAIITIFAGFLFFKYQFNSNENHKIQNNLSNCNDCLKSSKLTIQDTDNSFISRMKLENRQILVLYGSQTGTAEELARRLSKDLLRYNRKPLLMDPEDIEIEDFSRIIEIENPILLLCVATYGEGDPTDNCQSFYQFFANNECNLSGLNYAVFGLGNKTYEHYNEIGKFFDKRLEEFGAERVFELGLGDDDANLEEDFMRWRESFLPALAHKFGWELSMNGLQRQYRLEIINETSAVNVFTGEYGRVGAFNRQRAPFDQKNPYLSVLIVNNELHNSLSERSCRHIEFSVDSQRVRYETGDHLGVFPINNIEFVERIGKILCVNLDTIFKLTDIDVQSTKRFPFPCPCSYRTALLHYVDICAPIKSHVLRALSEFTNDEQQKAQLILLSTASEDGLKEYHIFIQKERRNILDILEYFNTCKPPIDLLLELLPRLQARYYSISSSPKFDNTIISITALVLQYKINSRLINGVCTNYLASKNINDKCPIFIRKSTMRLPHRLTTPVIMIGPGTGLAPFRGFLQERLYYKKQGKEISEMYLFYGCRHPDHDYIYRNELEEFVTLGVLTHLSVAFSRLTNKKCYVQHKIWENREKIWHLIDKNSANIYVCGDAKNMARDVQSTFLRLFQEVGKLNENASHKLLKDLERQRRYQTDVWS